MDIVTELKKDHKILKALYKKGLQEKTTLSEKRKIFTQLTQVVPAHAKSEERALYNPSKVKEEVKDEAFEGYEEHGLVDLLMEEMKAGLDSEIWEAKFTVVCELLEHHVEEEEEEYFPQVKEEFDAQMRKEMGARYRKSFDSMYAAAKRRPEKEKDSEAESAVAPN